MTTEKESKMSTQDTDSEWFITQDLSPNPNRATVCRTVQMREFAKQKKNNHNPAMGTELVTTAQF